MQKQNLQLYFFIIAFFSSFSTIAQNTIVKSSIGLTIDLPIKNVTHYYNYVDNNLNTKSSYLGIGFYLYYKVNQNKISFGYEVPVVNHIPALSGGGNTLSLHIIEALLHHQFLPMLNGVGGLNTIRYNYSYYADNGSASDDFKKKDQTIGITTGIEFQPANFVGISFLYRPTLINFGHKGYRDVLSLTMKFNINVWRNKHQ